MNSRFTFAVGIACGVLGMVVLRDSTTGAQNPPPAAAPATPTVRVDESKTVIIYANAYRIHMAPEEAIIDLGLNMANPTTEKPNSGDFVFTVSHRLVLTWANAKRLQTSLATVVKRYEDANGEIPLDLPAKKP
jgi:hypothetical protein